MINLIKLEFKRVFKSKNFYIALGLTLILMLIAIYPRLEWKTEYDYVSAWLSSIGVGKAYITLLFPALVAIPYSTMLAIEKKNNYLKYITIRTDKKKYLISKGIVNSICSGIILLVPALIFSGICIYCFQNPSKFPEVMATFDDPASILLNINPIFYISFYSLWMFFQGVVWSTVCYTISLISNNILIISVGPFLYAIISNFLLAIIGLTRYTPPASFSPYLMTGTSILSMISQPIVLVIFILGISIYYKKYEESIYV